MSNGDATLHREKPLLIQLIVFHREKPVFEGEMQTMVLKKTWNSHFLTSEFHSRCKNITYKRTIWNCYLSGPGPKWQVSSKLMQILCTVSSLKIALDIGFQYVWTPVAHPSASSKVGHSVSIKSWASLSRFSSECATSKRVCRACLHSLQPSSGFWA